MHTLKPLAVAACAGLIALVVLPSLHGDEWNKKTIVTVNQPIIAGNKVLDPGTYVWRSLDSESNRNIVQIFNQDQSRVETTVIAIPNYRMKPTGKTQFSFYETPAGVPKAVHAWFYPGDNYGQEFRYPKKLIAELAAAEPAPLPALYNAPTSEDNNSSSAVPAPAPAPEPAPEPQPEPENDTIAQNTAPAPQADADTSTPQQPVTSEPPEALPKTASEGPLIGLVGLLSLGAAGLLTLAIKRGRERQS